jgi:hypothetical protein
LQRSNRRNCAVISILRGGGGLLRSPSALLFDPGYDVCNRDWPHDAGFVLARLDGGLHQSLMPGATRADAREKSALSGAFECHRSCRQHWLR